MKLKDVFVGQKVGFNFKGEVYIGTVVDFNDENANVEFDHYEDSIVPLNKLIGVCDEELH